MAVGWRHHATGSLALAELVLGGGMIVSGAAWLALLAAPSGRRALVSRVVAGAGFLGAFLAALLLLLGLWKSLRL